MKSPSVTDFRAYFLTLARYHVWATARLYEKVDHAMGREPRELDMVLMLQAESKGTLS